MRQLVTRPLQVQGKLENTVRGWEVLLPQQLHPAGATWILKRIWPSPSQTWSFPQDSPLVSWASSLIVSILTSALMIPTPSFTVSTSHRCLVLYLQAPSKQQPLSPKLNIFPQPELVLVLALVLALPSPARGSPFSGLSYNSCLCPRPQVQRISEASLIRPFS